MRAGRSRSEGSREATTGREADELSREERRVAMSTKKSGLGRGLASLIRRGAGDDAAWSHYSPGMGDAAADVMYGATPQNTATVSDMGAEYREIAPSLIEPNPRQPRQVFDGDALAELVHSIREFGLMQPIVVRAVEAVNGKPRYQLVMGGRRWRAA